MASPSSTSQVMESLKNIPEFFAGRSVLITGGTGFMGKVLVEKLLRSCSDIETIYLLIRPKKGQEVQERLQDLISLTIFDEVRRRNGLLGKIIPIQGDITQPKLGLSLDDQNLLRSKVSVIFHAAATVKFDEALKKSVAINMSATKSIIDLALNMSKLEALIHVSTAYCNCNRLENEEQIYPVNYAPEQVLTAAQTLDSELLDVLTPKLLDGRPNTYTLTKALAEQIVNEQNGILPIAIIRPSIVTAAWKEPIPGWVDNMNGPTGIFVGACKGILRSLYCDSDCIADLVPVDAAINLCIAVAWHTAVYRPHNIPVYNCTTGTCNPIYWGDIEKWFHYYLYAYPSADVFWYPDGSFKKHQLMHKLAVTLFQRCPAYLFDFFSIICGREPMMVRIQDKILKATSTLEFFTVRNFRFKNDNMMTLWKSMLKEDKNIFNFELTSINWASYIEIYVLGIRKYILKEDPKTIPIARQKIMRMYILHMVSQATVVAIFCWLLLKRSTSTRKKLIETVNICFSLMKKFKKLT
nr:putative fatty acyl-CoA reductase CG5065 isoform X1 [Halyomorpha halys]